MMHHFLRVQLSLLVIIASVSSDRLYSSRGTQTFDAQKSDYFSSVVIYGIVGIAIAAATVVAGVIFGLVNEFGYRRPKKPCPDLCPSEKKPLVLRVLIYVASGLIVLATVLGFVGTDLLSAGTTSLSSTLVDQLNAVDEEGNSILSTIVPLEPALNFSGYRTGLSEIADAGLNAQGYIEGLDITRGVFIYLSFYGALLAVSLGLSYAILRSRKLALAFVSMGFVGGFLMWLNFTVHLPLAYLTDDLCYSASVYTKPSGGAADPDHPASWFVGCLSAELYAPAFNGTVSATRKNMQTLNNITTTEISFSFNYSTPSGDDASVLAAIIVSAKDIISRVTAALPTNNPAAVNRITPYLETATNLNTAAQSVLDLVNCQQLTNLVDALNDDVCPKAGAGSVLILIATTVVAVLLTISTAFGIGIHCLPHEEVDLPYVRTAVLSTAVMQIVFGFVGVFMSIGYGQAAAGIFLGIFLFAGSPLGIVAHKKGIRGVAIAWAVYETVAVLIVLIALIVLAYFVSGCVQDPGATDSVAACGSDNLIIYVVGLIYVIISMVSVFPGFVFAWLFVVVLGRVSNGHTDEFVAEKDFDLEKDVQELPTPTQPVGKSESTKGAGGGRKEDDAKTKPTPGNYS